MDLALTNLSKRFGTRLAVEIPSLTVKHKEFFTFVGPSGCGKSTTLNLIAGLETPTTGSIQLGERDLTALPPHRRDVAFVFQSYALYPHRTVFANLSFPLEMARVPAQEIRTRVERAAESLGLTALLNKYPRQLSGGERQRVALGRAMVRQPKLFLLDEPLSNLDAPLRAQMRKELKRLHRQLGCTFLYVTHDQDEALSLSDRIAVMNNGRVVQCAPPEEVYSSPADTFVASFFGSPPMNLIEATIESGGGSAWALAGTHRFDLGAAGALPAGPVILGIRPEDLRLAAGFRESSAALRVSLRETHGRTAYLEVEGKGLKMMATVPAEGAFEPGQPVTATLPRERLHFFDNKSGRRISTAENP
jgi:multiple sugar transport system ATP-binding protein